MKLQRQVNLLIILSLILLYSCSPSKRLSRLVKNHPELIKSDTVLVSDTTIINAIRIDTTFKNVISIDTITIVKDKLIIKYFNRGDSIFIDGEVKTDTIIKEIPVTVNSVEPMKEVHVTKWYDVAARWCALVLFLFLLILWLIKRR